MTFRARQMGAALALLTFSGLAGCAQSDQAAPQTMTVEGEGEALPPTVGRHLETPPPGLELERVTVERHHDEVRLKVVPREVLASRQATARTSARPAWSFAAWTPSDQNNAEPTYWVAVSEDPEGQPGTAGHLAVWLCDGESLRKTVGTLQCGKRSTNSQAQFQDEAIVVRIPTAELPELGPVFWWSVTAAAGPYEGAPPWVHCVPRCAPGDWHFPPASARLQFG